MPASAASFPAPPLALLMSEPLRAAIELCSGRLGQPEPVQGDGHPVVVYPGLGAGAFTTAALRGYLAQCGFAVTDWGGGVNIGPEGLLDAWLEPLTERVRQLHAEHGRKASLVGWSLGGVYAREIAKRCPRSVRQVITLATPFGAIDDGNHAGTVCRWWGGERVPPALQARLRLRPPVPTTSIYSESDGVVCWRGCLERPAPDVENVAVDASHLGMTSHPGVLRVIASRLAQPEGAWRPYRRRRQG